jgi:hypothetical protein
MQILLAIQGDIAGVDEHDSCSNFCVGHSLTGLSGCWAILKQKSVRSTTLGCQHQPAFSSTMVTDRRPRFNTLWSYFSTALVTSVRRYKNKSIRLLLNIQYTVRQYLSYFSTPSIRYIKIYNHQFGLIPNLGWEAGQKKHQHRFGKLYWLLKSPNRSTLPGTTGSMLELLGYGLTRPSDAQVVTGFELVTRT